MKKHQCRNCGGDIQWWKGDGQWVPQEYPTGARHECASHMRRRVDEAYRRGFEDGIRAPRPVPVLSRDELTQVIALVHPDRHPAERQPEANRVTARLLELRRAVS